MVAGFALLWWQVNSVVSTEHWSGDMKIKFLEWKFTTLGAAGNIIYNYRVKKLVHTGYEKSLMSSSNMTSTYRRFDTAVSNDDCQE